MKVSRLSRPAPGAAARAAEALIRQREERATPARVQVLGVLLAADQPLTHHEVEEALRGRGRVDRVTVYRVLEWLVDQELAHRIAGDDRVWRYKAQADRNGHAHFKCNRCGAVFCLENTSTAYALALPPGYRSQAVELTIRGLCAGCAGGQ
ncbi:MAG: Fur family transcriptional regulator [Burkholderiales bacterium]|nr:MAG: Fur family transcriptional regulator [Burkholderiales bacterium]